MNTYRFTFDLTTDDCRENLDDFIEAANWISREQLRGRDLSDEQQQELEESACIEVLSTRPGHLALALATIIQERDRLAEGHVPSYDDTDQGFDDWAADLAQDALLAAKEYELLDSLRIEAGQ